MRNSLDSFELEWEDMNHTYRGGYIFWNIQKILFVKEEPWATKRGGTRGARIAKSIL